MILYDQCDKRLHSRRLFSGEEAIKKGKNGLFLRPLPVLANANAPTQRVTQRRSDRCE